MSFNLTDINPNWTLFLDRDGVINVEKENDYIKSWMEFEFYNESIEALPKLASIFKTIVITTNQKGVGRGIMSLTELDQIHGNMLRTIQTIGGRIDHIFYCTDMEDDAINRKPQPGMAFQAKEKFPLINFNQSIMVGNRMSDMQFGRNAAMHTVFLATTHPDVAFPNSMIDYRFDHLLDFANAIQNH